MVGETPHILIALHIILDDDVLELGAAVLPEVAEHQHVPTLVIDSPPDLCVTFVLHAMYLVIAIAVVVGQVLCQTLGTACLHSVVQGSATLLEPTDSSPS